MAKKAKSGLNKSSAIRDYKKANPTASPKQIAEALTKTGLAVSPQFVSTVLSNAKKKGGKIGRRGRKPGPKPAMPAAATNGDLQHLIQAKKLVDQLGGVEAARGAINALAQLLG
jgi:hypothetical protein